MLAERSITRTTPAAVALLAPVLLSLLLAFAGTSRGDFIGVNANPDASRTAVWNMNTSAGLNPYGIGFNAGHAELPWATHNVSWTTPAAFTSNGTHDANWTEVTGGIGLTADTSNPVANPGFGNGSAWTYGNGTAQLLNATWNASAQAGMFHYASPSTETLWAAMDSLNGWQAMESVGDTAVASLNASLKTQGTASAQLSLSFKSGSGHFAGLQNLSTTVDWSMVNRLVLSVYLNASAGLTFNVSALDASLKMHFTSAQPLAVGWQNLSVDLDQLGPSSARAQLAFVTLRVNGPGPLSRTLLFDDLRIGTAKPFSDSAFISQSIAKADTTTATMGSAQLGLWWRSVNAANVTSSAFVSITGPGGTYEHVLPTTSAGSWAPFVADVSATTTVAGNYTVNVSVSTSVNTTSPCNLTLLLDNVSLFFPNRHNATYESNPVSLGNDSLFDTLGWAAGLPNNTSARLSFRLQLNSPIQGIWGSWSPWLPQGVESLAGSTGVGFQVRVALNTTNASVSPVLESVTVSSHHRVFRGVLAAGPWSATGLNFLWWRNLTAISDQPYGTGIQFYIGNGTNWTLITPGQSLQSIDLDTTVFWRAVFTTYDAVLTPTLSQVNLTYEYRGLPVRVSIYPAGPVNLTSGQYLTFDAYAWDAGNHPVEVAAYTWSTTDPTGYVYPNNGTYRAGTPGNYTVTANLPLYPSIFARVIVHVLPASNTTGSINPSLPAGLGPWWPLLLLIAAIGVGGFLVYEVVIRRLFSIDDVFLISKDGRLMMHNTRRMRADRDEDILSGMLAAIMAFLRDQDPEENGELKKFQVGGKTTLVERGRSAYLAAVYTGRVPRWAAKDLHRFMEDLDAHFGDAFRAWNGAPDDLQGLKAFTGRFARNVRYRRALFRSRAS